MPGFTSVARADTFALPAGLLNAASGLVVFVEELTHILKLNSNGLAAAVDDNPYDSYQRMPWGIWPGRRPGARRRYLGRGGNTDDRPIRPFRTHSRSA